IVMSMTQLMRIVAPPGWGWLADHFGRRDALVSLSGFLTLASFSLFFLVEDFAGHLIVMVLVSAAWSAALPLVEAKTLGVLRGRAEGYGRIRLWGSVGFIVAVVGVGAWLEARPLGSLLWICMALLSGIALTALVLPPSGHARATAGPREPEWLVHGRVLALLAACFLMSAAHGALYVFLSIHLVDLGYGKAQVGMLWSIGVLAEILVFLSMPSLLRVWSLRTVLITCFSVAVVRFLVVGWLADVAWLLVLAQLMHAITFGAYHASAVAALNRWFPASRQARVQAIYGSVSFGAGGMAGGLLAGWTWERLGAGLTFTIAAGFAALGLGLVIRFVKAGEQDGAPAASP
ncbi:MAG: MFS transporter, partial [Rhodocyclaceae bacterium]|nr:MFS transporter [Rhodocyclaceae bacterium]